MSKKNTLHRAPVVQGPLGSDWIAVLGMDGRLLLARGGQVYVEFIATKARETSCAPPPHAPRMATCMAPRRCTKVAPSWAAIHDSYTLTLEVLV